MNITQDQIWFLILKNQLSQLSVIHLFLLSHSNLVLMRRMSGDCNGTGSSQSVACCYFLFILEWIQLLLSGTQSFTLRLRHFTSVLKCICAEKRSEQKWLESPWVADLFGLSGSSAIINPTKGRAGSRPPRAAA